MKVEYNHKEEIPIKDGKLTFFIPDFELEITVPILHSKLAPRIDGMKQEKMDYRSSEYSQWHRTLNNCYTVDIDFVEWRNPDGIVALIDVTGNMKDEDHMLKCHSAIWKRTELQRKILMKLGQAIFVPAYFVMHTKDLSCFHVFHLPNIEKFKSMNQTEYEFFLRSL